MADAMTQGANMAPQTATAPADDESNEQFSVTITANGDGTYTVSSSDSDDSQDEAEGDGAGPQTAKSIDEAVQMAGQMLEEEAGEDAGASQDDPNAPVKDPEAAWNQLAKKTDKSRGM